MMRARRDHNKLLTLIDAIALLHQHQREIKTFADDGETLEYIEATRADVKLAKNSPTRCSSPRSTNCARKLASCSR